MQRALFWNGGCICLQGSDSGFDTSAKSESGLPEYPNQILWPRKCCHFLSSENSPGFFNNTLVAIILICAFTNPLLSGCPGLTWDEHTSDFSSSYSQGKNKGMIFSIENHHQLLSPIAVAASEHNIWNLVFQKQFFFAWICHHVLCIMERPGFFEKGFTALNDKCHICIIPFFFLPLSSSPHPTEAVRLSNRCHCYWQKESMNKGMKRK